MWPEIKQCVVHHKGKGSRKSLCNTLVLLCYLWLSNLEAVQCRLERQTTLITHASSPLAAFRGSCALSSSEIPHCSLQSELGYWLVFIAVAVVMVMVMVEENQLVALLGAIVNIYQRTYSIFNNGAISLEITKVKYYIS